MSWTPEMIDEALTDNFSGADGTEVFDSLTGSDGTEVFESYTGEDDDLIESYTGKGLKNLEKSTKRFSFKVENKTGSAQELVIAPGKFMVQRVAIVEDDGSGNPVYKVPGGHKVAAPDGYAIGDYIITYTDAREINKAGNRIDVVADDGTVYATDATHYMKVSATQNTATFRMFLEFLKTNPSAFAGMHINSDNTAMFEQDMKIRRTSPYAVYHEDRIPFQDAFRPSNMNISKIVVKRQFQLDGDSLAIITIPDNTIVTFSFVAGAIVSQSVALKKKIETVIHKKERKRKILHLTRPLRYSKRVNRH